MGIGTSAPSEKLHVNGNARATQICIGTDCRASVTDGQFFATACPAGYRLGGREGVINPVDPSGWAPAAPPNVSAPKPPATVMNGRFFCWKL